MNSKRGCWWGYIVSRDSLNFGYRQSWTLKIYREAWGKEYCLSFQNTFQRVTVKIPKSYGIVTVKIPKFLLFTDFQTKNPPPPPPHLGPPKTIIILRQSRYWNPRRYGHIFVFIIWTWVFYRKLKHSYFPYFTGEIWRKKCNACLN
jgi:hypothetical protein